MNLKRFLCSTLSALTILSTLTPMTVQAATINAAGDGGNAVVTLDVDAPTFDVTVPTGLPIWVSADGEVTTADDVYIINNGHGSVTVSALSITAKNGWATVDTGKDLSNVPVDTAEFSMTINNETTTGADAITFDQENWPAIAAVNDGDTDQFHLVYSATVAPQTDSVTKDIADVVFTIGWNMADVGESDDEGDIEDSASAPDASGVIPEGAFYYVGVTSNNVGSYSGATEVFTAGQEFPSVVKSNDVFFDGQYEYRYNKHTNYNRTWETSSSLNGWGVALVDKNATTAGVMYGSINGIDIKSMESCFHGSKVKSITDDFITPSNVEDLFQCFAICNELTYISKNFYIPDSVTRMPVLFSQSPKLTTIPEKFRIPDGVTDCSNMFYGCWALNTLPENFTIPSSVKKIDNMFLDCRNLTGSIIINAPMLNSYQFCFKNACNTSGSITISGTCPYLNNIAATCTTGKVTVS